MYRLLVVSFAAALLLVGSATLAWAQRTTATFQGIVVDSTGALLPGADVALTNEGTGIVERQVTSATGEFQFNYVPGGTYTVFIMIPGFRSYTGKGIVLGAAQDVRQRFQLEIGDVAMPDVIERRRPHEIDGLLPLPQQRFVRLQPRDCFT